MNANELGTVYQVVDPEVITQHIGDYMCLGGRGLIDGLKNISNKYDFERIVAVRPDCIVVRSYGAHQNVILPEYNYRQQCLIVAAKDYKKIPVPVWARR